MTTQPDLFHPFARTHATQRNLFAGLPVAAELECATCGVKLVQTESGWLVCPNSHGGLVPDGEPCGSWFEEDAPC